MPERCFTVYGRVQGVGFRWWTRSQAQRLGVAGTVRNRPDGSVEVRARGADAALDALRDLLRTGPPGAQVERVDQREDAGVPDDGFEIVR